MKLVNKSNSKSHAALSYFLGRHGQRCSFENYRSADA